MPHLQGLLCRLFTGVSKSVQVVFNGIDLVVLTFMILKERALIWVELSN